MSALPPIADIGFQSRDVRFVPKADSCTAAICRCSLGMVNPKAPEKNREGQGRGLFHRRIGREATRIARLPIEPLIFFPEICNGHDRWERMGFAFGEREITR